MKRYGNLWHQLISFDNIYLVYKNAVKGKTLRPYSLYFIKELENNLIKIQNELISKNYQPGKYNTFYIYEPKKRMISSAPFVDRIVHHCLVNMIGPIFEETFINHSYANRKGKGTHRAIRYVQNSMRLNSLYFNVILKSIFLLLTMKY